MQLTAIAVPDQGTADNVALVPEAPAMPVPSLPEAPDIANDHDYDEQNAQDALQGEAGDDDDENGILEMPALSYPVPVPVQAPATVAGVLSMSQIVAPDADDIANGATRKRKVCEILAAQGAKDLPFLVKEGHMRLTPLAVRKILSGRGHLFVFQDGILFKYDPERGLYVASNERFAAEVLALSFAMETERLNLENYLATMNDKVAKSLLSVVPPVRGSGSIVSDCEQSLFPGYTREPDHVDRQAGESNPNRVDGDQFTLNVKNGLFCLKTRTLREHTKDHLSSIRLPFEFDAEATCPNWEGYITAAVPDAAERSVLQEFLGYCLIPTTRFEKSLFLLGPGGSGKSTFVKMARKLVGKGNCSAVGLEDLNQKFKVAELQGKLLNTCTEINPDKPLDDSKFKALVSGDPFCTERKHRNPTVVEPYARFLVSANTMPRVNDLTDAFERRLIVVKFERKFVPDPDPDKVPAEAKADPLLQDKLDQELSGLLNWALVGLTRLLARKRFDIPASLKRNVEDFRVDQNSCLRFIREVCEFGKGYEVSASDLYRAYEAWAKTNRLPVKADNVFGRVAVNHPGVVFHKAGHKGRHYKGIRLPVGSMEKRLEKFVDDEIGG